MESGNIVLDVADAQPANFVPQFMTKVDVAERLRLPIRKVSDLSKSGRLPTYLLAGSVRFKEEDVLRLVQNSQGLKPRLLKLLG